MDATAPVRRSTHAVVDRNLITGLASIRLVTLQEDSPLLTEAHAAIPEGESQLQQFSQTMSQLAQRADETMQRVSATLSTGAVNLSFPTTPGKGYRIDDKTDLNNPVWQALTGTNVANGSSMTIPDNTAGTAQRVYRIVVVN